MADDWTMHDYLQEWLNAYRMDTEAWISRRRDAERAMAELRDSRRVSSPVFHRPLSDNTSPSFAGMARGSSDAARIDRDCPLDANIARRGPVGEGQGGAVQDTILLVSQR